VGYDRRCGCVAVEKQLPAAVVEVVIVEDADHDPAGILCRTW